MSDHRSRRIDRRTAEQLLHGDARVTGHDRLHDLLAAAAAPARDRELAGEQAAVAAFRDARLAPAPQRRRPWMLKIALANLLSVKIAAAAAAAAGGIALAAAAGSLPGQQREEPKPATDTSVVTTSTKDTVASPKPDKKPENSPSPSLKGLCQAWTAGAGSEHGKAHENPAFSALISAAGGADKVPAFCEDQLADKPGKSDQAPGKSDQAPGKPDQSPGKSDQAPGKPTR